MSCSVRSSYETCARCLTAALFDLNPQLSGLIKAFEGLIHASIMIWDRAASATWLLELFYVSFDTHERSVSLGGCISLHCIMPAMEPGLQSRDFV